MSQQYTREQITLVPKDFLTGPIFAARSQKGVREIRVPARDGGSNIWRIGGMNPLLEKDTQPLDVSHARVLFALIKFRDPFDDTNKVTISLSELAQTVANSRGGRFMRDLRRKLAELRDIWIELVYDPDGEKDKNIKKTRAFTLLGHVDIVTHEPRRKTKNHQKEIWLDYVELHPEFLNLLRDIENMLYIRWDVFKNITSNLAQALYLYLPSRAQYYDGKSPWKVSLTTLLEQTGMKVPSCRSVRKKIFTQNKSSVLSQLNGAELFSGTLRIYLEDTADKKDYNLCCYVEKSQRTIRQSELKRIYLEAGHTEEEFNKKLTRGARLDEHEVELLEQMGIKHPEKERGLQLCKAIIGGEFSFICRDVLAAVRVGKENGKPILNPGGLIMSHCKNYIRNEFKLS